MNGRIPILGTGRMGAALARAFLSQGHSTAVWNRTRAKAEPLAALGARIELTFQSAAAWAEVVVVVLSDCAASDALLRRNEATRSLEGKLLLQLTSGTPRQANEASLSEIMAPRVALRPPAWVSRTSWRSSRFTGSVRNEVLRLLPRLRDS